jgi:hypothetical protein
MFIDFDTKALFGSATQQLCHPHIKDIALEQCQTGDTIY